MFAARKTDNVSSAANYIEEVFSTYLYTGNGTTQTITNGIDLAGKGGMVWIKSRSNATGHHLSDTATGITNFLSSDATFSQQSGGGVTSANSNGFGLTASGGGSRTNTNGNTYASWTFRKQAKFFDVVTYTGNGVSTRDISHSLGSVPGCIIIKRTDASDDWRVYHRGWGFPGEGGALNLTAGFSSTYKALENVDPTATTFRPATPQTNTNGATYVAYLFAHDAGGFGASGSDNVISCGSFTTDGSGNATVSLGYEPQWVMTKRTDAAGNWTIVDVMRGMTVNAGSTGNAGLYADSSGAEIAGVTLSPLPNATGMTYSNVGASRTFIYIAIRRGPMKTPTTGTSVFSTSTYSPNTGTITSGFPTDFIMTLDRATGTAPWNRGFADRLRGRFLTLSSASTGSENTNTSTTSFDSNTGTILNGGGVYGSGYVYEQFRRAPGFFDVVCYTGTGVSNTTVTHNLGASPELMLVKNRSISQDWRVVTPASIATNADFLLTVDAMTSGTGTVFNTLTSSSFKTTAYMNSSGENYVAYLFASCPGVSKVGSYTGNGSNQTINCGFTAGARFVMIKRTDSTGDWYVWDTARGIVAGNDPRLSLNSTAAEVTTDDSIDPDNSGFIVNQLSATNINVNAATYIFLAVS